MSYYYENDLNVFMKNKRDAGADKTSDIQNKDMRIQSVILWRNKSYEARENLIMSHITTYYNIGLLS